MGIYKGGETKEREGGNQRKDIGKEGRGKSSGRWANTLSKFVDGLI